MSSSIENNFFLFGWLNLPSINDSIFIFFLRNSVLVFMHCIYNKDYFIFLIMLNHTISNISLTSNWSPSFVIIPLLLHWNCTNFEWHSSAGALILCGCDDIDIPIWYFLSIIPLLLVKDSILRLLAKYQQEIILLSQLSHPNIVRNYGSELVNVDLIKANSYASHTQPHTRTQ